MSTIPKPSTDIHSSMRIRCPVLTKWFPISLSIVFSAHWILGVPTIRYPSSWRKNLIQHFEACGRLYQFCRIPFGVTNGVASFQRVIDEIISNEKLKDTVAYIDDVTVCGYNEKDHNHNVKQFMATINKYDLTLNEEKCSYNLKSIKLLGYIVRNGAMRPDPERLKPLMELSIPGNIAALQWALGMFAHYSQWVVSFSKKKKKKKIHLLTQVRTFPLSDSAIRAFQNLKRDIANSAIAAINPSAPLVVETNASDLAIAASLRQHGQPVAFFSRTLSKSERRHTAIEKEAYAIVEALWKWKHYLIGRHFHLITNQKSVSFMFDPKTSSKIKNEKIARWRMELSCYSFDVSYRPGKENAAVDALSRVCGLTTSSSDLQSIHRELCHPSIIRMKSGSKPNLALQPSREWALWTI